MAKCPYCSQNAGFLRRYHKGCKEKYELEEKALFEELVQLALENSETDNRLLAFRWEDFAEIVPESRARELEIFAWERAVSSFLENNILSHDEEFKLIRFAKRFSLEQSDLNSRGWYVRSVVSAMLRDISEGRIPNRLTCDDDIPFNFLKSENLIYLFPQTKYLEMRTKKHYEGGHHGASIRIARGLYYRLGTFKGRPVETQYTHSWGFGLLALTTKNLYFHNPAKSFRIPYRKITSFDPYDDGIGIMRDNRTAKPEIFVTGDGWAVYNLAVNLARVFG